MDFIKEFLDYANSIGKINSSTLEIYRKDIEDFDGFIVGKELLDVKAKDIAEYIEELKKRYSDRSIYRKLSSLKSFYKYLLKNRIIEEFPLRDIELPERVNKVTQPLEKWELKRILDICNESFEERRDVLIIRLLYETGFKIGDILSLEKDNLKNYDYKIVTTKSASKIISERLSEELSKTLEDFVEVRYKDMYTNKNKIFEGVTRENFRVRFINYGKRAKLSRAISPSMIRKIIVEEKVKDEAGKSFIDKIREKYMEIGIGDD